MHVLRLAIPLPSHQIGRPEKQNKKQASDRFILFSTFSLSYSILCVCLCIRCHEHETGALAAREHRTQDAHLVENKHARKHNKRPSGRHPPRTRARFHVQAGGCSHSSPAANWPLGLLSRVSAPTPAVGARRSHAARHSGRSLPHKCALFALVREFRSSCPLSRLVMAPI